jgi:hypothetical protein
VNFISLEEKIMVRVVVNNKQGLVQKAGGGTELANDISIRGSVSGDGAATGMEFIKYGAVQSLNAFDDYDDELALPAGAMITDVGVQFQTICKTGNVGATDVLSLKVGYAAGGTDIINNLSLLIQNKTAVAGSMTSVSAGNLCEAAQPAPLTFVNACLLRDAAGAARSVHTRLLVSTTAMATPGTARTFVKYIII